MFFFFVIRVYKTSILILLALHFKLEDLLVTIEKEIPKMIEILLQVCYLKILITNLS